MSRLIGTGIEGLDTLLGGGLREGTCTVVEGCPGTGKTTIGLQFIHCGCLNGEPGIVVTFEQLPEQIYADAEGFGWQLQDLEEESLVRVICTSPDVFLHELSDAEGMIDGLIREMGVRRILVDSVSHLVQMGSTPQELRALVYGMFSGLKRAGLTSIVTREVARSGECATSFEGYMADTVIGLSFEMGADLYRRRYIEVHKSRGRGHAHGKHTLKLGDTGPLVYPRLVDRPHLENLPHERLSTGVVGLDTMLSGGIQRGHTFLVAGSAGVGKTTLGLSFINAGVQVGETAVYVSFEEPADALVQLADGFGMALANIADDKFRIMHCPPVHLRTDEFIAQLEAEIERLGARRVVIDSITDLALAAQDSNRLRETVYAINAMLKQHGITAILTTEVPELFGQTHVTNEHISIIVDGIILMKYLEMESEIQRAISVLKMRGSDHDKDIRRFIIDAGGLHVQSRFEGAEGLMAGSARSVSITLSVRSFTEIDEQHNQELLQRFSQVNPRVTPISISLPYNPDEARKTVDAALAADVSELSVAPMCLYWMSEILQMDRLQPLDELLSSAEAEEHLPELLTAGRADDHTYAIPALATCGVLLYRKDLLEEFSFQTPPETWDELIEQATTVVAGRPEEELIGYQFPGYMYEGLTTSFLQNLWSNGARLFDGDEVSLDEQRTLETLVHMHDLIYKHSLVPRNIVTAAHGLEPQKDFVEGRTVFLTLLPSVAQAAQRFDSPVRGKIGISCPPMGPHGEQSLTFLSGWLYGIPRGARAPQAARQFIRFMTSPQVQKERALRGGPLPTIEAIYSDPEVLAFNPDYTGIREMLRTAICRSEVPQYSAVSRIIQEHLHAMLRNDMDPAGCMRALKNDLIELAAAAD